MGNVTLTVDCGGTGIKASVFDQHSKVLVDFPYLKTPYPMSPNSLVEIISNYVLAERRQSRAAVPAGFAAERDSKQFEAVHKETRTQRAAPPAQPLAA